MKLLRITCQHKKKKPIGFKYPIRKTNRILLTKAKNPHLSVRVFCVLR
jgi:hypothetical protein